MLLPSLAAAYKVYTLKDEGTQPSTGNGYEITRVALAPGPDDKSPFSVALYLGAPDGTYQIVQLSAGFDSVEGNVTGTIRHSGLNIPETPIRYCFSDDTVTLGTGVKAATYGRDKELLVGEVETFPMLDIVRVVTVPGPCGPVYYVKVQDEKKACHGFYDGVLRLALPHRPFTTTVPADVTEYDEYVESGGCPPVVVKVFGPAENPDGVTVNGVQATIVEPVEYNPHNPERSLDVLVNLIFWTVEVVPVGATMTPVPSWR